MFWNCTVDLQSNWNKANFINIPQFPNHRFASVGCLSVYENISWLCLLYQEEYLSIKRKTQLYFRSWATVVYCKITVVPPKPNILIIIHFRMQCRHVMYLLVKQYFQINHQNKNEIFFFFSVKDVLLSLSNVFLLSTQKTSFFKEERYMMFAVSVF